jgi:hypothetical protein
MHGEMTTEFAHATLIAPTNCAGRSNSNAARFLLPIAAQIQTAQLEPDSTARSRSTPSPPHQSRQNDRQEFDVDSARNSTLTPCANSTLIPGVQIDAACMPKKETLIPRVNSTFIARAHSTLIPCVKFDGVCMRKIRPPFPA